MNHNATITWTTPHHHWSIWLKYLTGTNLDQHCINSLHGPRHPHPTPQLQTPLHLTLHPDEHIYLCGVSQPYVHTHNFHLLATHKPGHTETHTHKPSNTTFTLTNLKHIPITPRWINPTHPKNKDWHYNTCRNWWAAWYLHTHTNLPNTTRSPRRAKMTGQE
jgi:hypothetical protein